jgi:AcrR family transcriptional regulator
MAKDSSAPSARRTTSKTKDSSASRDGSKERILAAAEQIFAESGFDGATVRQIAIAADVPIALISYHFGGKEGLYKAIFELRTPIIVGQRFAGMEIAEMEADPGKRLELLVRSLIAPMFKLRAAEQQSWFGRILSREVSDPKSGDREIVKKMFDPVAHIFVDAMARCRPELSKEEVHWAYQAMIGTMVYIMADNGRIARLSGGSCDPNDFRDATRHITAFLVAGFKGM